MKTLALATAALLAAATAAPAQSCGLSYRPVAYQATYQAAHSGYGYGYAYQYPAYASPAYAPYYYPPPAYAAPPDPDAALKELLLLKALRELKAPTTPADPLTPDELARLRELLQKK